MSAVSDVIRVECYAGYRGEQEPQAFWLGGRRLEVVALVDRWYSPNQRYFRCQIGNGDTYVIRYDESTGQWDLAAFTKTR